MVKARLKVQKPNSLQSLHGAEPSAKLVEALRPHLDSLFAKFDRSFLTPDPLVSALRYSLTEEDLEVSALFCALIAYGRADLIEKNSALILGSMGGSPAGFCRNFAGTPDNGKWLKGFKYRFNDRADIAALAVGIGKALHEYGSLENLFVAGDSGDDETLLTPAENFLSKLIDYSGHSGRYFRFLMAGPGRGGCAKRINLYLRWMVRKDDVDPGPWNGSLSPSRLVVPLDTHVARIARRLGILKRKSSDLKAALEVTKFFRALDKTDPIKYDFAICSYGKLGFCVKEIDPEKCEKCTLAEICLKV